MSLRFVRSPEAPKMTRAHGSGRRRIVSPSSSGVGSVRGLTPAPPGGARCPGWGSAPGFLVGLRGANRVAAELVAERRVHLGGERLRLARGEAREERRA